MSDERASGSWLARVASGFEKLWKSDRRAENIENALGNIAQQAGGSLRQYPQPGLALRRVVLRDRKSEEGTQYEDAALEEGGAVRITGRDTGPGVSEFFGPEITSYEWVYVVSPDRVAGLVETLGGSQGDDVLQLLRARYEETGGTISDLLKSPEVGASFDNWHS